MGLLDDARKAGEEAIRDRRQAEIAQMQQLYLEAKEAEKKGGTSAAAEILLAFFKKQQSWGRER